MKQTSFLRPQMCVFDPNEPWSSHVGLPGGLWSARRQTNTPDRPASEDQTDLRVFVFNLGELCYTNRPEAVCLHRSEPLNQTTASYQEHISISMLAVVRLLCYLYHQLDSGLFYRCRTVPMSTCLAATFRENNVRNEGYSTPDNSLDPALHPDPRKKLCYC